MNPYKGGRMVIGNDGSRNAGLCFVKSRGGKRGNRIKHGGENVKQDLGSISDGSAEKKSPSQTKPREKQ